MTDSYRCHDCHMSFGTVQLLQKHKQKFCVGGSLGDPDSLLLRRGLRSADEPVGRSVSPDDRPRTDTKVVNRKVKQLLAHKKRQEKLRDIRNLEERILLDALEDSEQRLHGTSPTRLSKSRLPLSKDKEVQNLQLEYEKVRKLEKMHPSDLLLPAPDIPLPPPPGRDSQMGNFSVMSNTSMSIHLPDDDYQRYNPNQDAQLRQLAENHGRQMEYLQLRNRDLEKQKEDIRRRLEELGSKGRPSGGDDQAALLAELRAQEERNQRALEDLRRQLYDINHKRVNVIEVEKPSQQPHIVVQPAQSNPPPPPQPDTGRKSYIYPVYYGSSLVAEISAIRQAYLQNGGNDPDVLAQMSQMQAEAQAIEDQMKRDGYDNRHRDKKDKDQFRHLEMENERLHRELLLLQEQNFLARERKKSDREGRNLKHLHAKHSNERVKHGQKHTDYRDRQPVRKYDRTSETDKLDNFMQKYGEGGNSLFYSYKDKEVLDRVGRENPQKYKAIFTTDTEKKKQYDFKHTDLESKKDLKAKASYPSKKPYVPPLDLRQITETEEDIYSDHRNPKHHYHSPRDVLVKDSYRHAVPHRGSKKHNALYGYGKSKSYYDPHTRKGSSKTDKSLRSEIMEGVIEPRRGGKKFQMVKGSLSENDLVGLFSPGRKGIKAGYRDAYGKSGLNYNVQTVYSVPADRKLETISIKHRDEMNPKTQNVISTVTYKEERIREKAKV